jgi:formylglycine-generating enzyme required for sulfatase activity
MANLPAFPRIDSFNSLRFLEPYSELDESIFPKRDDHARVILDNVKKNPLVIMSGASGCGKSSLINAQIIPTLKNEGILPINVRFEGEPQKSLLAALYGLPVKHLDIHRRQRSILQVVADKRAQVGKQLVIILDGFEEILDFRDTPVIQNFLDQINLLLFPLAEPRQPHAHVLISINTTFLTDLKQYFTKILGAGEPATYYYDLPHLSNVELSRFFDSINQSHQVNIPDDLAKKLLYDSQQQKLRTIDIQSILNQLVLYAREKSTGSPPPPIQLNIDQLNELGGSTKIIRSLLDTQIDRIIYWLEKSRQNKRLRTGLPHETNPNSLSFIIAQNKRGFHTILKSTCSERMNPVLASRRGMVHRVISDVSGINRQHARRLIAALSLSGLLIKRYTDDFNFELRHSVLCSMINAWINKNSDEFALIRLQDKTRRILNNIQTPENLVKELTELRLTPGFTKLGFSLPELRLFFQTSLLSADHPAFWYQRLIQESVTPDSLILQTLDQSGYKSKIQVIKSLFFLGDQMIPHLIPLLDDEYPEVRATTIAALEQLSMDGSWRSSLTKEAYVMPGKFIMGDNQSVFKDESPAHEVLLAGFYISRYPVTNANYKLYSSSISEDFDVSPGMNRFPKIDVNWYEARQYAQWASARLPTEAEWEKAASWHPGTDTIAPHKRIYPWGNDFDENKCNMRASKLNAISRVGKYSAIGGDSYYQCGDMVGNIWEWTSTTFKEYPYRPDDGREEPTADGSRVIRGGSFENGDSYVTCTVRAPFDPYSKRGDLGFRLVLVIPDANSWQVKFSTIPYTSI